LKRDNAGNLNALTIEEHIENAAVLCTLQRHKRKCASSNVTIFFVVLVLENGDQSQSRARNQSKAHNAGNLNA